MIVRVTLTVALTELNEVLRVGEGRVPEMIADKVSLDDTVAREGDRVADRR